MQAVEYRAVPAQLISRTIVTAADHRYYRTLCQLLMSIERHRAATSCAVLVFDLGLTATDRRHLSLRFPWCRSAFFDFSELPPPLRRLDICAWKPIAIDDTLRRYGGLVLWLDAATVIRAPLDPVFDRIARDGMLTLVGQAPIRRWCHEATIGFMEVAADHLERRCRVAGIIGFNAAHAAVRDLVDEWRRLALVPECIAPPGADRRNHRYDQSILNLLLVRFDAIGLMPYVVHVAPEGEEVDISSVQPARWASTRNKVPAWVPLTWDPIVRASYAAWKAMDRAALSVRAAVSGRSRVPEDSYRRASPHTARR